jgi:hypothetical protein
MFLNGRFESVSWTLRVGLGAGIKLRIPDLRRRIDLSKEWHNHMVRIVSRRRYLPGHQMRVSDARRGLRRPALSSGNNH